MLTRKRKIEPPEQAPEFKKPCIRERPPTPTSEKSSEETEHDSDYNSETEFEKMKKEDPETYEIFLKVKEEICKTEPNIQLLLKTHLTLEDKAKMCQYYEIYKSQQPNTNE